MISRQGCLQASLVFERNGRLAGSWTCDKPGLCSRGPHRLGEAVRRGGLCHLACHRFCRGRFCADLGRGPDSAFSAVSSPEEAGRTQTPPNAVGALAPVLVAPRAYVGEAPVVAGNRRSARKLALSEAFASAVSDGVSRALVLWQSRFPPAFAQGHAPLQKLNSDIQLAPERWIRRYRLLEEGAVDGLYTVRLEATLYEGRLRRALLGALASPGHGVRAPQEKQAIKLSASMRILRSQRIADIREGPAASFAVFTRALDESLKDTCLTEGVGVLFQDFVEASGVDADAGKGAWAGGGVSGGLPVPSPVFRLNLGLEPQSLPVRGTDQVSVSCTARLSEGADMSADISMDASDDRTDGPLGDAAGHASVDLRVWGVGRDDRLAHLSCGRSLGTALGAWVVAHQRTWWQPPNRRSVRVTWAQPGAFASLMTWLRDSGAAVDAHVLDLGPGTASVEVESPLSLSEMATILAGEHEQGWISAGVSEQGLTLSLEPSTYGPAGVRGSRESP